MQPNQKSKKKKRKEKEENYPLKLSGRPVKQVGTPLHKWGSKRELGPGFNLKLNQLNSEAISRS